MQVRVIHLDAIQTKCQETHKDDIKEEQNEEFHVAISNTIVYPRTVMVHAYNAAIALTAVMGTWGFV